MISRREWLGISLGAGASRSLTPALLHAMQQASNALMQRPIPSTGEMLPVIGLTFGNIAPSVTPAALEATLRTLVDHGGKFFDVMHVSRDASELGAATTVSQLGVQQKLFLALRGSPPGPPQPGADAARAQLDRLFARFAVPRIDLVQVHALADPAHLAVVQSAKQEGRVRYVGVQVIGSAQYATLASIMRNEPIDFIGVDFAIDNRGAEETILPLARERKIGVVSYFPFGGGSIFRRAGTAPLPEWAADFDAKSWAQFFLKYVVSHPAVTVARAGTSQASHLLDDIGGGVGRLPTEATRTRMAALVDAWPKAARGGA